MTPETHPYAGLPHADRLMLARLDRVQAAPVPRPAVPLADLLLSLGLTRADFDALQADPDLPHLPVFRVAPRLELALATDFENWLHALRDHLVPMPALPASTEGVAA
jgi:hypothetical protein